MPPQKQNTQQENSLQKLLQPYHPSPGPSTNSFSGLLFWGEASLPTTSLSTLHSPLALQPAKENNERVAIAKTSEKDSYPPVSRVYPESCWQDQRFVPSHSRLHQDSKWSQQLLHTVLGTRQDLKNKPW